jgi:hypothetical protein
LGSAGANHLCINVLNQIASCSSSARYKTDVNTFSAGVDLVRKFQPVSFAWAVGGTRDMGLVAEEVAKVEPLLVTYNKSGEVEGVKYDRIGVVLVNAVKQQQTQIEDQRIEIAVLKTTIKTQQEQIDLLRKAVCEMDGNASVCKEKR